MYKLPCVFSPFISFFKQLSPVMFFRVQYTRDGFGKSTDTDLNLKMGENAGGLPVPQFGIDSLEIRIFQRVLPHWARSGTNPPQEGACSVPLQATWLKGQGP